MILKTNSKRVSAQLRGFKNATDLPFQTILKNFMLFVLARTAERTPVSPYEQEDPGRLAGSWTISRDQPGQFMIPKGQTSSKDEAAARAQTIQFSNPYAAWYIYNRVEYATVVEYGLYPGNGPRTSGGFSKQAPAGMLRLTWAEAREILEEVKAKHVRI